MKYLLVEDDENKRKHVCSAIREADAEATVVEVKSLRSGQDALRTAQWDLVILDMSIPAFDITRDETGGRAQGLGGRDLLRQMQRLGIESPVVVLTQYDQFGDGLNSMTLDELNALLTREHGAGYLGAIVYNVMYDQWRQVLFQTIAHLKQDRSD